MLGPDRNLVVADGQYVELTGLGGDVGGDALPQHVFLQHHPAQVDVGMLFLELRSEPLHHHHVAIVHSRDGDRGVCAGEVHTGSDEEQESGGYGSLQATPGIMRDGTSPHDNYRFACFSV